MLTFRRLLIWGTMIYLILSLSGLFLLLLFQHQKSPIDSFTLPSETEHFKDLRNLQLSWLIKKEKNTIVFTCIAKTSGWVGVGLGQKMAMDGAELAIAGINSNSSVYNFVKIGSGTTVSKTYFGISWKFLGSLELSENIYTKVVWERKLDSVGNDLLIKKNSTSIILTAFGRGDTFSYHGHKRRDVRKVNLWENGGSGSFHY